MTDFGPSSMSKWTATRPAARSSTQAFEGPRGCARQERVAGSDRQLAEQQVCRQHLVAAHRDVRHLEAGAFANPKDRAGDGALELVARLFDVGREIAFLAVVLLEQLDGDDRIDEQVALEVLLVDDRVERIGVDRRGAGKLELDRLGTRPGGHREGHLA
jgi:hypothetical protein